MTKKNGKTSSAPIKGMVSVTDADAADISRFFGAEKTAAKHLGKSPQEVFFIELSLGEPREDVRLRKILSTATGWKTFKPDVPNGEKWERAVYKGTPIIATSSFDGYTNWA